MSCGTYAVNSTAPQRSGNSLFFQTAVDYFVFTDVLIKVKGFKYHVDFKLINSYIRIIKVQNIVIMVLLDDSVFAIGNEI